MLKLRRESNADCLERERDSMKSVRNERKWARHQRYITSLCE